MKIEGRTVRQATMDTFYYDGSAPDIGYPCEVILTDEELVISYDHEGGVVYRGKAIGPGHYELTSKEEDGRAVMHCLPGSKAVVGSWRVGQYTGLWKVTIS